MTRKPLVLRKEKTNCPFQMVWWKPLVAMQKDMARTFTDAFAGTPFGDMLTTQEEFFETLEDNVSNVFGESFNNRQMLTPWLIGDHTDPYIDIIENKNGFKVKAELPGVKEQDINVSIIEGGIQIEGEKYEECAEKGENYRHQECHAGYFSRSIAMPEEADLDKAKIRFNLNVLTIEVPKKAAGNSVKGRKMSISVQDNPSEKVKTAAKSSTKKEDEDKAVPKQKEAA